MMLKSMNILYNEKWVCFAIANLHCNFSYEIDNNQLKTETSKTECKMFEDTQVTIFETRYPHLINIFL